MGQLAIVVVCLAVAGVQLRRVPRLWAFLLLFIVLTPKVPLAVVPGNTTPLRVDDLVIGAALVWWAWGALVAGPPAPGSEGPAPTPAGSPATLFLLLYWGTALACTLVGIAALTTEPLTGILHVGRMLEYGLLYYLFFSTIRPDDLPAAVEVFRTALLLVCGIWIVQHWTHAPAEAGPTPWGTLYPTFSATYDFGGYLMIATTVLYAVWSVGRVRDPLTSLALAGGVWLTLNSDSRASLVGLIAVVALDAVMRARWKALVVLAAAGAAAPFLITSRKMLTLVHGVGALITSRDPGVITQAFATDPSLALRARNWRLAVDHWLARPFSGDGLGGYLAYIRQYDMPASPDGWYVRMLADTGVAGFTAFMLLVAALLWMLFAAAPQQTQPLRRAIVYAAGLGVVAALVSAVLVDTFVSFKIMGVFWMVVAVGTRVAAQPQAQPA